MSKFIRKRVGLNEFKDISPHLKESKMLDFGCGIGRHLIYSEEMGIDSYGIDLSENAIQTAKKWALKKGIKNIENKIIQGEGNSLPWSNDFFDFAISHGVLDSMSDKIAQSSCLELARVLKKGGLFYCDLISGDDSKHSPDYHEEEIVQENHENGTIQNYYNFEKINALFNPKFKMIECHLIRRENKITQAYGSRYHVVLQRL